MILEEAGAGSARLRSKQRNRLKETKAKSRPKKSAVMTGLIPTPATKPSQDP